MILAFIQRMLSLFHCGQDYAVRHPYGLLERPSILRWKLTWNDLNLSDGLIVGSRRYKKGDLGLFCSRKPTGTFHFMVLLQSSDLPSKQLSSLSILWLEESFPEQVLQAK